MQSPVKRICPEERTVPVKEGLSVDTLDDPLIVKLVVSDDKVTLLPALMHLMFVPINSCSAPATVNPLSCFVFQPKRLMLRC